jgi:hypothetical protein
MFEPYAACSEFNSIDNQDTDNGKNVVYDWSYFKNKYSHFIKNEKTESKKRNYDTAFGQETYDYSRFGEVVDGYYRFKLNGNEFKIPFNSVANDTDTKNMATQEESEEEEVKKDFEEEDFEEEDLGEEGSEEGEVKEEESNYNYEYLKNEIERKFDLIDLLLREIHIDDSNLHKSNRYIETLY